MEDATYEFELDDITITRVKNGYTVRPSYARIDKGCVVGFKSEVFVARNRGEALDYVINNLYGRSDYESHVRK